MNEEAVQYEENDLDDSSKVLSVLEEDPSGILPGLVENVNLNTLNEKLHEEEELDYVVVCLNDIDISFDSFSK